MSIRFAICFASRGKYKYSKVKLERFHSTSYTAFIHTTLKNVKFSVHLEELVEGLLAELVVQRLQREQRRQTRSRLRKGIKLGIEWKLNGSG